MKPVDLVIYDKEGNDGIPIEGVTKLSFIDNESHGDGNVFGITDNLRGRAVIISSPNVAFVQVDPT